MHYQSEQWGSRGASSEHPSAIELAEWLKQAASALRYGDLFKAQALYQRILDARPDHPEALSGLGVLRQQRGLLVQAEQLIAGFLSAATLS